MMDTNVVFSMMICVILVTSSSSQECPGPVSFNSPDFTIRGPCPNDTVLVAVGSTIQYRCHYTDNKDGFDLPYWHIPELSGTPFQDAEGSEHGITVSSVTGPSGYTTLTIPVKEQYLNNTVTLTVQCGLCSNSNDGCDKENRLSENVTSTAVSMIAHGSPRYLSTSVSNGIVMFQWSRPLASDDNVVFIYTVQLMTNTSSVPILSFNTTNTNITLSRLNITGNDRCIEYTLWSVSVENSYNTTMTVTDGGNISFIFQEEPSFSTSDITTKISSCSSTIRLELSFAVSSLQPLHTLDYDVWLNDTINISYHSKHNTSITFPQHQLVIIEIPLVSIHHDEDQLYITVTISNECGEDTVGNLPVNGSNVSYCTAESSSLPHSIPPQTATLTYETLSIMTTILPNNGSTNTNSSPSMITVIIVGCICAGVFMLIILLSVTFCAILYTRYSVLSSFVKNIKSSMNISPSTTMNQINNNPLSSAIEQTQEEPKQQINICYDSVKRQDYHDNGSGTGAIVPLYEEINTINK